MCTTVNDYAQIAECGLKPSFENFRSENGNFSIAAKPCAVATELIRIRIRIRNRIAVTVVHSAMY